MLCLFKRGKGNNIEMARGGCKEEVAKPNYILKDPSAQTYHRRLAKDEGRRAKRVWSVLFNLYGELF